MGGKAWQFKTDELIATLKTLGVTGAIAAIVEIMHTLTEANYIWSGIAVAGLNAILTALRQWAKDNSK